MCEKKYRIGELALKANVTSRTVRYYESLGLLTPQERSEGGQRYYSDRDLVQIKRIIELKDLDFSLEEISKIIKMKWEDTSGNLRRTELLHQYRNKLSQAVDRKVALEARIDDISWHIRQLESNIDFRECPGNDCKNCIFRNKCIFYSKQFD